VRVPSAEDDRPAWGKVAVLAVVGFAVGIAWPRFAGVRLGPSAPAESIAAVSRPSGSGGPAGGASPASLTAAADDAGSAGATGAASGAGGAAGPLVTVNRGMVLSCRTAGGDLQKGQSACGDLSGLDALVTPRLRKLATCPAAAGQSGKLSVVLGVDFAANRITAGIGKSSTVPDHDALATCLHAQLDALTVGALHHDQAKYTVQYTTTLASSGASPASGVAANLAPTAAATTAAPAADPGASTGDEPAVAIVWDVAIVRDTPRTGSVVARLSRGTKIHVAAGQDGWYRVKYGSGFSSEGWVYRGAIGK
jgi:hypothetical protein